MWDILGLAAIAFLIMGIQLGTKYLRSRRLRHWFQRGMTHYKEKQYEQALDAFRRCIRIAPEWLHARTLMGICLAQTGRTEEALREIEMVEALQPREAETWTLIASFFLLCMPDDEARLFQALERLTSMDEEAARTILSQPCFKRYADSPRLRALKQQLAMPG